MSVQVWIGEKPEYSNERKAIVALAQALNELSDLYVLLVNFNVHNAGAVDLVVLKRNGIFVVDLKHCEGKVVGEINGDWKIVDQQGDVVKILNEGRQNPYNQVKRYYYGLLNFLNQNKTQFLSKQKASQVDFKRIKSTVVISPKLLPDSKINVGWPVEVIGLDEFHQYLFNEISQGIDLTEAEMIAIPKMLNCEYWQEFERLLSPIEMTEILWKQYLQSLANEDRKWQKFYVPLDVTKTMVSKISDLQGREHKVTHKQTTKITSVVEQSSRVVLLGKPGAGKTTILEHLAISFAEDKLKDKIEYIPILVKLNLYDKNRDGLLGLIKENLRTYHRSLDNTHIRDMLDSDVRFLFMFDGLNEISREQMNDGVRELRRFLITHSEHKYLISCREQEYTQKIEDAVEINLQGFKHQDISSFFSKFFEHHTGRAEAGLNVFHALTHRILNIATSPLLTSIIAEVAKDNSGQIPESRSSLFDRFVSDITQREIDKGDVTTTRAAIDAEVYLGELAFHMHQGMMLRIQQDKARRVVRKCWENLRAEGRCSYSEAEAWQEVWNSNSTFLLKSDNRITFRHQLFQEFFAAKKLSELLMNEDNKAFDYLTNSWWHESVIFAIGMMEEPSFVVEYLVGEKNARLLGKCLAGEAGTLVKTTVQKGVQKLLDSTNEVERLLGIELLGAAGNDLDAIKMLLGLVSTEEKSLLHPSESEEVLESEFRQTRIQQKAVRKLRDLDRATLNPDLIDVVGEVSHLSPAAREEATNILGRLNIQSEDKRILRILSDRLQDSHGGVRFEAIQCLENRAALNLDFDTKIIELLREASHEQDLAIGQSAREILMEIGEIESEPNPDRIASLLKGALAALERGDTEFGLGLAVNRFDPHPLSQKETEEVIRQLGNERYEQLLILSLSCAPEKLDGREWWGILSLGIYGSDSAIQTLLKYLRPFNIDDSWQTWRLRWAAAEAFARIGTASAMQTLIDLLSDKELIARLMASIGLEIAQRSIEHRKLLLQIEFDSDQLRTAVESCFTKEVGTKVIQYISHLQSQFYEGVEGDKTVTGTEIILNLLKRVSRNIVIDVALGALNDEHGKMCAIWIIGELGDRNILPRLEAKLSDLDVHTEVNQAIQKIIQRAPEGNV